MDQNERNGLQEIIDNALAEMAEEAGEGFDPSKANLAVFCSKTGLTRSKARTLKKKGFKVTPHGRCGMKLETTVLTGYTDTLEKMLRRLELDLYYLEHRSWWFDVKILFNTFLSIAVGKKF